MAGEICPKMEFNLPLSIRHGSVPNDIQQCQKKNLTLSLDIKNLVVIKNILRDIYNSKQCLKFLISENIILQ